MKYANECHHPEENYLFAMDIEGECCDVWIVQKPHQKFYKGHIEFCLRYGNQDHEYRSSWDCNWIERSIAFHNKFSYDYPGSAIALDQFIELKEKLKALDCWDADIDLSPEITEVVIP
jgi:hypothetical protein